jgi:hypothetical protein
MATEISSGAFAAKYAAQDDSVKKNLHESAFIGQDAHTTAGETPALLQTELGMLSPWC